MGHLESETLDRLFDTVLKLNSKEECYRFFEDLCTVRELKDLSSRLQVAELLSQGMNYQQVENQTGISSATISRVKRCLEYGTGGYHLMISRMKNP